MKIDLPESKDLFLRYYTSEQLRAYGEACAAAAYAEAERLRSALKDCADDLEAEIQARADGELPRRIDRDLEAVRRARELLRAAPNSPEGGK